MGSSEESVEVVAGASLEGLDKVFDPSTLASEVPKVSSPLTSESGANTVLQRNDSSEVGFGLEENTSEHVAVEVITTEEAAKRLGISARAVLNRIKAGSLNGKRIKGRFKEEWRVLWCLNSTSSEGSEVYSEVSSEPVTDEGKEEATHKESGELSQNIVFVSEQLRVLTEQTQILSYRNGYLEAQLEASRTQLKLLPDFQSKASENELLKARIKELEEKLSEQNRPWWQRLFRGKERN